MPARATSIVVWLALAALLCESTYAFSLASVPGPIGMRRKTTALLRMCEPTSATAAATASDNLDADTAASCPSPLAPDGIAMATTTFERPFKGTSTLKKTWVDRSAATGLQFPANVFNSYGKRQLKLTDPKTAKEMKGTATWIAIGIFLAQPIITAGHYQMTQAPLWLGNGAIEKGNPISMATSKDTGLSISCREAYKGAACWPSGFDDAFKPKENNRYQQVKDTSGLW